MAGDNRLPRVSRSTRRNFSPRRNNFDFTIRQSTLQASSSIKLAESSSDQVYQVDRRVMLRSQLTPSVRVGPRLPRPYPISLIETVHQALPKSLGVQSRSYAKATIVGRLTQDVQERTDVTGRPYRRYASAKSTR